MTIIEFSGFVFGVAGVWLTLRENVWCFPVGLANVILSLFLFMGQQLYSDALQQIVYVVLLSYGWFQWLHGKNEVKLKVTRLERSMFIPLFVAALAAALVMGSVFHYFTNADVPYLDASATAMSFVAQYLIAKKKIENWILWMVVNVMYIGIYLYKELYLYLFLFVIYLVLAIIGYRTWKKELLSTAT